MGEFGTLNWTILTVYILGNLVLGFYLGKRIPSRPFTGPTSKSGADPVS